MESVKQFIIDYVERKGKIPDGTDLDTFNFVQSGHVDSINIFKLAVDIEMEFGVEISDDDMMSPEFMTIGGIVAVIQEKMESGGNG